MKYIYYKIILLVTAFSQLISPYISNFSGGSNFNELLITPAGYTFSIWGAITILAFIFSFYHVFFDSSFISKRFYKFSSALYVLFTLWLIIAEKDLIFGTLIIFLIMLYLVYNIFAEVLKHANLKSLPNKIFLQGSSGMYLGWSSVAIWANLGIWFLALGMDKASTFGIFFQCLLVLGATCTAIFMLNRFSKNIVLFGTFWWAFVGILIGTYMRTGFSSIFFFIVLCVLGLNYYYFKVK